MGKQKTGKPRLTKEQIAENKRRSTFSKQIAEIFSNAGFTGIAVRGWQFQLGGRSNELDHAFIFENVLVICEDTLRFVKEKEKALNKGNAFNRNHKAEKEETSRIICDNKKDFFELLKNKNSLITELQLYSYKEFKVFYLYFEYGVQRYSEDDIKRYPHLIFVDKSTMSYFYLMSKSIKASFKYELFKYFDLKIKDIGKPDPSRSINSIDTSIIYPETVTGYQDDVRMVSFMMRPADLLRYSYVLRKDGWDKKADLYQRLIMPKRIKSVRDYVVESKTAFMNNIIVTLPSDVKFFKKDGDLTIAVNLQNITNYENDIVMQIPAEYNSIGIIDGQHRVYAFYEDSNKNDASEKQIESLRNTLSLLVTGIIYPENSKYNDESERRKFESDLFATINKNAKPVDADILIQVSAIMNPTSGEAISRRVIESLNKTAPFENLFQLAKTENAPIKTASIIKYALSSLLNAKNSPNSLYKYWLIKEGKDESFVLENSQNIKEYVNYCSGCLIDYFKAVKTRFLSFWNGDSKLLKVISINAFIIAFRETLEKTNGPKSYDFYRLAFNKINLNFDKDNYAFPYAGAQYSMFAKSHIIPKILEALEEETK